MRNNNVRRKYSHIVKCESSKASRFRNEDGSLKLDEFKKWMDSRDSYSQRCRVVEGYGDWFQKYSQVGWDVYLLSVTFQQLSGNRDQVVAQMFKEISWVYGRLLTRRYKQLVNKPKLSRFLPRAVFFADRISSQRKKTRRKRSHNPPNESLHVHGLVAVFRLKDTLPLEKYIQQNKATYIIGNIEEIDVVPITTEVSGTTKYGAKSIKQREFTEYVLVLPRSDGELSKQREPRTRIDDIRSALNLSDEAAELVAANQQLSEAVLGKR